MNGYVIGGYLVVVIALGSYALFLVGRLRASRRRLGAAPPGGGEAGAAERGQTT